MSTYRAVNVSAPARLAGPPDPRLAHLLRGLTLTGLVMVLLLPAAREHTQGLGWLPLWLVGMPLTAWWSLYRFRLPLGAGRQARSAAPLRRRRRGSQARRRKSSRSGLRTAA